MNSHDWSIALNDFAREYSVIDSTSWCYLIGGLSLFISFLLSFQKGRCTLFSSATLWVVGTIVYCSMRGNFYRLDAGLSDAKMFWLKWLMETVFVLMLMESALLFPWISKKQAMYLGKILLLIITPTLLLFISVLAIYPSSPMVWFFPLGASYIGHAMLWFRIREKFDGEKTMVDPAVPVKSKFRMAQVAGWSAYCVIVAFLLLLAAPDRISRPIFAFMFPQRPTSSGNPCMNNLRNLDAAANQFAAEHNLTNGAPIHFPDDLTPYIRLNWKGKIPPCPAGGIYHISKVGEPPTCSLGSSVTPSHALP